MRPSAIALGCLLLSSTCLAQTWLQVKTTTSPPPRALHGMSYDLFTGRTVLFGGFDNNYNHRNDTWEYDGKNWIQIKPVTSPPARCCSSMAYDSARRRVVLFGGNLNASNPTYYADTWEFDGKNWVQVKPTTSPPARTNHDYMVYDIRRGRMIVFGGWTGPSGNAWGYLGVRCYATVDWHPVIDLVHGRLLLRVFGRPSKSPKKRPASCSELLTSPT